jgi:hypothetical protein
MIREKKKSLTQEGTCQTWKLFFINELRYSSSLVIAHSFALRLEFHCNGASQKTHPLSKKKKFGLDF